MLYVVKYTGPFGFIKPWTAVRDGETFSQQFLTPSIIEGIEKKIFSELLNQKGISRIVRHKLSYSAINSQQEQTQTRGWEFKRTEKRMIRPLSILNRGIMINPVLHLAFKNKENALKAYEEHICLCRNEDVVLPIEFMELSESEFDKIDGFELRFGESDQSFMVGFNRFNENKPMYGWIEISGKPVLSK